MQPCNHATNDNAGTSVMADDRYPVHHRSEVDVAADAQHLFAFLDDHRRLASHMEKPSLMMAGATLRVETDGVEGASRRIGDQSTAASST